MIFFDIDGTLLDHKGAELEGIKKFYEKYAFNQLTDFEHFKELWVKFANKNFNRYLAKELSFEEQRANRIIELFAEFHISVEYEEALDKFNDYLTVYEECWKAYDDVIPCLEMLKGKRLGIISNGDHEQQVMKLEKIGIKDYFEDIVTAGSIGVAKPNVKIFEMACERNGVNISDCYYIGDDIKSDINPCNEIGLKAILINRAQKEVSTDVKQVRSLVELGQIII